MFKKLEQKEFFDIVITEEERKMPIKPPDTDKSLHPVTDPVKLGEMRKSNNPQNKPTGHHTGRCSKCGSNDLWDDNLFYGCNSCGAWLN